MSDAGVEGRAIHVVKVGGSLLDIDDLPGKLAGAGLCDSGENLAMVVGGGRSADWVRHIDRLYKLDDEQAHWLAIAAMQFNTVVVSELLDWAVVVKDFAECKQAWADGKAAMVDPYAWLGPPPEAPEVPEGEYPPCRWTFTGDSIAAYIACGLGAVKLTLLKSANALEGCDVKMACDAGLVDGDFEDASQGIERIEIINLQLYPSQRFVIR